MIVGVPVGVSPLVSASVFGSVSALPIPPPPLDTTTLRLSTGVDSAAENQSKLNVNVVKERPKTKRSGAPKRNDALKDIDAGDILDILRRFNVLLGLCL